MTIAKEHWRILYTVNDEETEYKDKRFAEIGTSDYDVSEDAAMISHSILLLMEAVKELTQEVAKLKKER